MNSQTDTHKRFFIKTLGCKVNQYETQAMREILTRSGFSECLSPDMADIYILNTCTVTEKADRESRHWLSLFHRTNPKAQIIVTGCYVEKDSNAIAFLPGISHIIKNDEKGRIAEILNNEIEDQRPRTEDHDEASRSFLNITDFKNHTKAFIKIQDGCENRCSYCKVPFVRGRLRSRPISDILVQAKVLIDKGFKEIVLTGVCLGAWGKDSYTTALSNGMSGSLGLSLVDVLKELNKLSGDFRIRLSSIEPKYVTDDLIGLITENKKMCKHLHIPLQSGDDEILKRMNRPYSSEEYRALVDKIRSRIGDIAITTDVMIGFPGETDQNFRNTLEFIKYILPARTHIFSFSRRAGTAAYDMADLIKKEVRKNRYYELTAAALSASYLYRSKFLNKKMDILVETRRDRQSGFLTGYSDNYIKVIFQGPDSFMRSIVPVVIDELSLTYTLGRHEPD